MLKLLIIIGCLSSLLMFFGDMILYYDSNGYDSKNSLENIIEIMCKVSKKRLFIGGIIGPISAFFSAIGFLHIYYLSSAPKNLIIIISIIYGIGISIGGVYHSQCAYLGLMGRLKDKEALEEVLKNLKSYFPYVFAPMVTAFISIAIFYLIGWMKAPRWMAVFTPAVIFCLKPLIDRLPTKLHAIIGGGWTNLPVVIYYLVLYLTIY